jgi:hypothetical protein
MTHEQIIKALQTLVKNPLFTLRGDTLDGLIWLDERPRPTDEEIINAI